MIKALRTEAGVAEYGCEDMLFLCLLSIFIGSKAGCQLAIGVSLVASVPLLFCVLCKLGKWFLLNFVHTTAGLEMNENAMNAGISSWDGNRDYFGISHLIKQEINKEKANEEAI